jgi:hypothetical protein
MSVLLQFYWWLVSVGGYSLLSGDCGGQTFDYWSPSNRGQVQKDERGFQCWRLSEYVFEVKWTLRSAGYYNCVVMLEDKLFDH